MEKHRTRPVNSSRNYDLRRENLENGLILFALILTFLLSVFDAVSDIQEGASVLHLVGEAAITTLIFTGIVFLWRRTLRLYQDMASQVQLTLKAESAHKLAVAESVRWRKEASVAIRGLSDAIDAQLCRWSLTSAEKEVALLLLKGLSLKEVAAVRGVSEKTARAQSLAIYGKSNLSGRAELSAFFLEDLMLSPQENLELI
jgi:DNA-binding CsgD family transcriptional regulator